MIEKYGIHPRHVEISRPKADSTGKRLDRRVFSGLLANIIGDAYRGQESIRLSDLADQIEVMSRPTIIPLD